MRPSHRSSPLPYPPGQDGGAFSGAPALSPGPEFPGPPPTLFCPGLHCLEPGPGAAADAGPVMPRAAAAVTARTTTSLLTIHLRVGDCLLVRRPTRRSSDLIRPRAVYARRPCAAYDPPSWPSA